MSMMEKLEMDGDVLDPEYIAYLRAHDPVRWDRRHRLWAVTRHDEIAACLADTEGFSSNMLEYHSASANSAFNQHYAELIETAGSLMISRDEPDHLRLRRTIEPAFRQRFRAMEPEIRRIAHRLVDRIEGRPSADLVADFCNPLPLEVICRIVGAPEADHAKLDAAVRAILKFITFGGARTLPELKAIADEARHQLAWFNSYCEDLLQSRREFPREDLLSDLARAGLRERESTEREVVAQVLNVFLAGFVTVARFLGMAVFRLLRTPHLYEELVRAPDRIPNALEVLLRMDSPSVFLLRYARRDAVLGGKQIRQGELVMLHLDAGNFDPARYACPHAPDFRAKAEAHLSFGKGVHFCMGARLARMEAQTALDVLVERLPSMRLIEQEAVYNTDYVEFRGLEHLRISPGPRP